MQVNADLVRGYLAFLDFKSLLACEAVSHEWRAAVEDPFTWQILYCMRWRCGAMLPHENGIKKLSTKDWKRIYRQRQSSPLEIWTQGKHLVQADGTVSVVSNKVRASDQWHEGICTQAPLQPLAFSRMALHWEVCYFEARFLGCGSVGLIPREDAYSWQSHSSRWGWMQKSYSFHSNNGHVLFTYYGLGRDDESKEYGPSWGKTEATRAGTEPDTIGCGVDLFNGELFFTKNGKFLGFAPFRAETGKDYMAAVMLRNYKDAVDINVGRKAFVFDLEGFLATGPPVAVEEDND